MDKKFQGINRISIRNYKSIDDITINIRPVTVLAGANSTGKSSLMQPLLLMKQTFEMNGQSSSPLTLKGTNVEITSFEEISTKILGSAADSFSVQVESDFFRAKSTFNNAGGGIDLSETTFNYFLQQTKPTPLLANPIDSKEKIPINTIAINDATDTEKLRQWMFVTYPGLQGLPLDNSQFIPLKDKCFYSVGLVAPPSNVIGLPTRFQPSDHLANDIRGIIHLPRWRAIKESGVSLTPPFYSGTFQNYTASLIEYWEKRDHKKYSLLVKYLRLLNLSTGVSAQPKDKSLEILLGWHQSIPPKNKTDMVGLTNVGVGVSQALPILVALVTAETNQIVYIEQPELHLHPSAHIGLVETIMDASRRKVKVIVETHSATFLLALQTMIAEQYTNNYSDERILQEDVALYWFSRKDNGASTVHTGTIDNAGTYGDWPVDFASVIGRLQRRYLETMHNEEVI